MLKIIKITIIMCDKVEKQFSAKIINWGFVMGDIGVDYEAAGILALFVAYWVVALAFSVFYIFCMWRLFVKAGEPGWAAIIPIVNIYYMLKIAGKPGWWILLMLIPFANFVVAIMMYYNFLKAYGRGTVGSVLLLLFFGAIYIPYLALSSNVQYVGV